MAMDYVSVSKQILDAVGGAGNISSATNCMTRLRLILKDESRADDNKVQSIKGVKSVIKQGGQYQIVIGNEVSNLFKEFAKLGNFTEGSEAPGKATGNPVQRLFGFVAGCMVPMLPAMLGAGMLKVVLTLLTTFAGLDTASSSYILIYSFADSFFAFLPIFLGFTIAKKMNGNPMLFMLVGASLCYPSLSTLLSGGSLELGTFLGLPCTYLFGLPVICATYTSSVLPMLLMAPVMKWAEDFGDRVSPNMVKSFLKPLIFIIICVPTSLYVLGPLGYALGNVLSGGFSAAYSAVPWLTVGVLSAAMPFIVMTGMHYALVPLCTNNLALLGYDVILIVTMFCSNIAQGGASLGVAFKSKNTETKSEGMACGISAIVGGITEPAMYGINLRYMTPMAAAVIGAGVSGLFAGITGVKAFTMGGSPSILSLIQMIGGDSPMTNVAFGVVTAVITFALSFGISFISFKEPEAESARGAGAAGASGTDGAAGAGSGSAEGTATKPLVEKTVLTSPLTGTVVAVKDVPDQVFSSGAMGEGAAIIPTEGKVVAPCDGIISATMETRHAVGITGPNGMELLIHVGLDTVELGGKFFECPVKEGDKVKRGDLLLKFDMEGISKAGYKLHTPLLVTNADEFVSVMTVASGSVRAGDELLSIV